MVSFSPSRELVLPQAPVPNISDLNELRGSTENELDIEKAYESGCKGLSGNGGLPRSDTVLTNTLHFDDASVNPNAVQRNRTLERSHTIGSIASQPRFSQRNRVIGEFKTLSINLTQDAADSHGMTKIGKRSQTLKNIGDLDWHRKTPQEAARCLGVAGEIGLDTAQVERRLALYGQNVFSKPPNKILRKIIQYVFGGFGSLLIFASIMCFVAWKIGDPPAVSNLALALVLLVVVLATTIFNAWQDFSTTRVMESVRNMLPSDVPVLRESHMTTIAAADIVQGDILIIKMGAKVAADCRVISIQSQLKFDRSSLTGESDAVNASLDMTNENYLETRNILLAGTKCVAGEGVAIVTATGDATVFGRLAKLSSAPRTQKTTLEKEIFMLVLTIASLAITVAIVCVIIWAAYLRPKHPDFMNVSSLLVNVISILVAFVPEGLPAAVSLSLTVIAARMRRAKVLVKSLSIVETLGAVNVVCSDKTGTLTQNMMSVQCAGVHGFHEDTVDDVRSQIEVGAPIGDAFSQLAWVAGLCNAAVFEDNNADGTMPSLNHSIIGDATDSACLRFADSTVGVQESKCGWNVVQQLSFNSKNKFALRLVEASGNIKDTERALGKQSHDSSSFDADQHFVVLVKGAPDVLFPRCMMTLDASGEVLALTSARLSNLLSLQNAWASQGMRVIMMARKIIRSDKLPCLPSALAENQLLELVQDLAVVGLVGIVDPPRPEIPSVVKTVRRAGSRFMMVTGDGVLTAAAIARQCGIVTADKVSNLDEMLAMEPLPTFHFLDGSNNERPQRALSLTGPDLMRLQPEDWERVCNFDEIVFARTTPDQKLRIVKEFQARNGIVAMTGDGVNDAPALKQADCGIAMSGGSEVAIEAADLVLLDSFSSFVDALLYGRVCFDNLKKTIAYLLPAGTFAELWAVLLSFFFGLPQALSNIQMILICVLTDLFPSLSLIHEKPESDVLLRKPRNTKKERLANAELLLHAYCFVGIPITICSASMAFWYMQQKGIPFSDMFLKYGGGVVQTTDPAYFNKILYKANSIYFFNLVIQQYFDLLALRTRRLSLFQQWPFGGKGCNMWILPAVAASFSCAILLSYIPPIQHVFLTDSIPVEHFFLPMAFGVVTLSLDELRKLAVRTYPKSRLAKLAW